MSVADLPVAAARKAPESNGAIDYAALADEVVNLPPPAAMPVVEAPAPVQVQVEPLAAIEAEALACTIDRRNMETRRHRPESFFG